MQMQKNSKKFIVIHPILIALFPVFLVYSQNIHLILIQGIIFPILIILGITIAIWASIRLVLKNTRKRVYVFDGDGNILMNLGSLTTIGKLKPKNLIHLVFDNQSHDSTGGQPTNSDNIDLYLSLIHI